MTGGSGDEDGRDIALVGVCGAGKSTVVRLLRERGYRIREIHQEHSYVPHMWRTIHPPEVLIYLDASWDEVHRRRPHSLYTEAYYHELVARLRDARAHADVYVLTDGQPPEVVADAVAAQLAGSRVPRVSPPTI